MSDELYDQKKGAYAGECQDGIPNPPARFSLILERKDMCSIQIWEGNIWRLMRRFKYEYSNDYLELDLG
jgi:hypothetical protein